MGDNTCGCCRLQSGMLLAVIVITTDGGVPRPVVVKLCVRCRHHHWRRVGTWLAQASGHVYERTAAGACPWRAVDA